MNPNVSKNATIISILSKMQVLKGDKGDKGDTPVKGTDYFTDKEIEAIISYVQSNVSNGKDGAVGPKGDKGDRGRDGIDGTSPDVSKIIKEVLSKIPKTKDGVSPDPEKIAAKVMKSISLPDTKSLVSKDELVKFLQRGGFRGGGDTVVAGSNVVITINSDGQKVIASTGSGVSGYAVVNASSGPITATATSGEVFYNLDTTAGSITITLPTAVGNNAKFVIKKKDSSANTITVLSSGGNIDGSASFVISAYNWANTFYSDSFDWYVV